MKHSAQSKKGLNGINNNSSIADVQKTKVSPLTKSRSELINKNTATIPHRWNVRSIEFSWEVSSNNDLEIHWSQTIKCPSTLVSIYLICVLGPHHREASRTTRSTKSFIS